MSKSETSMDEKMRGKGVGFNRIRRITGYLVGTLDRFNSGKRAEEHDRVKHDFSMDSITDVQVCCVREFELAM